MQYHSPTFFFFLKSIAHECTSFTTQKITSVDTSILLQLQQFLQRKAADKNALQNHKSLKSVLPSLWFYHGIGLLLQCCRRFFFSLLVNTIPPEHNFVGDLRQRKKHWASFELSWFCFVDLATLTPAHVRIIFNSF